MRSAEAGEDWGWCYVDQVYLTAAQLAPNSASISRAEGSLSQPPA
jgi:hypothetical protein